MVHRFTPFLWSLTLLAGPPEPVRAFDPPRLAIEPKGKLDLGALGPREGALQRYTFTNTSAAPITLRVFDLSPGVRVTGAALQGPLAPHASAELLLRLDPTDWSGRQTRNVRLGTDDPRQGNYYLPIEFTVRPDLTVDGERRDLGDVAVPGSAQAKFVFTRETGGAVVLRVPGTLPDYLDLDLRHGQPAATLAVTLRTSRVPPGVRMGVERIPVETTAPMQPRFDLYVSWKLHHAIEAEPSRVVFTDRTAATATLTLKAGSGQPFRVREAQVEGRGFRVEPAVPGPAGEQRLTVRREAAASAQAMLVLRFQGEPEPLQVPLVYSP